MTKEQTERLVVAIEKLASAHASLADTLKIELNPNDDTFAARFGSISGSLLGISDSIRKNFGDPAIKDIKTT